MLNIVFDLDSTLSKIEGIDQLAVLKGVEQEVISLTNQAMNGDIALEDVFSKRLELIKPNKQDLETIGQMYIENTTDYAEMVIKGLQDRGNNVYILTGGYQIPTKLVADRLRVKDYYSNEIIFNPDGSYKSLNLSIPLWKSEGKEIYVKRIKEENPNETIMVGDGIGDSLARADKFICFTGVAKRHNVVTQAQYQIADLRDLLKLSL